MRISKFQADTINNLAKKHFGQGTIVYLFGSRTEDKKRGGDIDLFVHNITESSLTAEAKIGFLAELKSKIGDRKIDVIFDNEPTRQKINFYRSVTNQMIEL